MLLSQPLVRAVGELGRWVGGRRRRFRVVGSSMEPTLEAGGFVLLDPARRPEVGDIVVLPNPDDPDVLVVKRVAERTDEGDLVVVSDNPTGATDSRRWGPVAAASVVGCVTLRLDRPLGSLAAGTGRPDRRLARRLWR